MKKFYASAAMVLASLFATPAIAQTGADAGAPWAVVRSSDLNLATPAGREALDSRVRQAAHRLCSSNMVEPLNVRMARRSCYSLAVRSADRQVQIAIAAFGTTRFAGRSIIRLTIDQ